MDKQFDKRENILKPCETISDNKKAQQKWFKHYVVTAKCEVALNILLSNDLKYMVVEEVDGIYRVVPLLDKGPYVWSTLTSTKKQFYSPRRARLFPKASEEFIKEKVEAYLRVLVGIYKDSSFKVVYHSSVLERVYFGKLKNAEIYIALINYYLQLGLRDLNLEQNHVYNRNSIPIEFRFINVSGQFHDTKSTERIRLFEEEDVRNDRWVHRTMPSMKNLMARYLKVIRSD